MTTITIPRNLKKEEDLVILPRAEYEALLVEKSDQFRVKRDASFKVPKKHEAFYDQLDKDLTLALREVNTGKVIGPFQSVKEAQVAFESFKKTRWSGK